MHVQAIVSAQVIDKRSLLRTAAPKVHMQEAGKSRETVEIMAKSSDQVTFNITCSLCLHWA